MSSSLWNLVGETAQELGYKDTRGRHSAVIREMLAAAAAKWSHSPYVCRSSRHAILVTSEGNIFYRQVQTLRLNSRDKLPCGIEMKPEKRDYYHRRHQMLRQESPDLEGIGEFEWFQKQWMINYFSVWTGKKESDDLEAFQKQPLSSHVDTFGTTYKSADLAVDAMGGRFLTREIIVGLRDYVQWKEPNTPIFDRIDIPIDIPTSDLEACVIVDKALFESLELQEEEVANLALEFRNRESARFEGKEVALYPEIAIEELYGRSPDDEGADEMLRQVRSLRQRIAILLESRTTSGEKVSNSADKAAINASLRLPQEFLFYRLRWPAPHLGIEVCVHWEKPVRRESVTPKPLLQNRRPRS